MEHGIYHYFRVHCSLVKNGREYGCELRTAAQYSGEWRLLVKYTGRIVITTVILVLIATARIYGNIYYNFPMLELPYIGIFAILICWWLGSQYDKTKFERRKTEELLKRTEKLSIVGQLASGIAHEIRNPLTSLKGFIQLFQSQSQPQQTAKNIEYYGIMLSEINRINGIVDELLLFAKPKDTNFEKTDIRILLESTITLMTAQAVLHNIEILSDFNSDILYINCDSNKLKQVFINILKNAIEAMPNGGQITVQLNKLNEDEVTIRFVDEGCGIPKEELKKVGEIFYSTKEKGTGLGLMVSHKIIQDHQGSIYINSEIDKGTVVKVLLPIVH
jgi:signal transduction histidine kinase